MGYEVQSTTFTDVDYDLTLKLDSVQAIAERDGEVTSAQPAVEEWAGNGISSATVGELNEDTDGYAITWG